MGSTNKTLLGFNNWIGSDTVQRIDFVNDNILLDNLLQPNPLLDQIKKVDGNGSGLVSDSCANNSATATKLISSRKIKITGDMTGETSFDGTSDVTITTTQNNLITSGENYIKFADGTMIQYGASLPTNAGGFGTINLPIAFINTDYKITLTHYGTDPLGVVITGQTTNQATFSGKNMLNVATGGWIVTYIAIGKWK